jgi:hypothetical protein
MSLLTTGEAGGSVMQSSAVTVSHCPPSAELSGPESASACWTEADEQSLQRLRAAPHQNSAPVKVNDWLSVARPDAAD